jgi:hypothetical protein
MSKKEYAMGIALAGVGMTAYSFEWYLLWGSAIFVLTAWFVKSLIDVEEE